jgi:hypothetical protein
MKRLKKDLTFDKAFDGLTELVEEIEDDEIRVDTYYKSQSSARFY